MKKFARILMVGLVCLSVFALCSCGSAKPSGTYTRDVLIVGSATYTFSGNQVTSSVAILGSEGKTTYTFEMKGTEVWTVGENSSVKIGTYSKDTDTFTDLNGLAYKKVKDTSKSA